LSIAPVQLKSKTTSAIGDLLRIVRSGRLHGIAYAIIKEDDDGGLSAGSNVIWNGDPRIEKALGQCVETLKERMNDAAPKSKLILPN